MYKAGKHAADTAHTLLLQTVNMTEAYINSIGNCLRRPVLQVHSLQHLLLLQRGGPSPAPPFRRADAVPSPRWEMPAPTQSIT